MASLLIGSNPLIRMALLLLTIVTMTERISFVVEARDLSTPGYGEEAMKVRHEKWMAEHGRTYKDEAEKARRFEVFKANVDFIHRSNAAGDKKYTLGLNKFADITRDEFTAMYTGFKPVQAGPKKLLGFKYENITLSDDNQEVDWRQKGAVTGIKNQGQCGCCWAFSAVAAIEGLYQITSGQLASLSEQQLLDCSTNGNNNGCSGGVMNDAFQYIVDNGGITTEEAYPYTEQQGMCQSVQPAVTISGYQNVPAEDENALAAAVANQPVSVGVDASDFHLYQQGIMTADGCGENINHAVTAIGYGRADDGTQYWLLKNQWGETWGEGGYMRLQRGVGACGIGKQSSYPVA
ncbi:hypothetical protein EJB05_27969 [Eragrostis curvula]|uniref:Cathepsin propeptide inhibitor domain-containing protein n=1 Tax=Eragrostis curvula TaxID=38414 RepID=A0A5J9UQB9_9POAL|nr:hypothetical protein EJB05_54970 [Eragrostis curvula]TVU25471.1 hypothetical protein EJB05_27969 [Eragrostis curvula]